MAEVFGIAAGAIGVVSLSIQLAESLQKVKRFYGAVKNAPPQVEELVEEIEIMQDILSDLESGSQSAHMVGSASMRRCMKVAQRATKSFVAFSDELQTRIKKSRFRGGVKFALSREDIKQMLDQLERTKSSLNLAYNLYQQATSEDRHGAIISALASRQDVAVGIVQSDQMSPAVQDPVATTCNCSQAFRCKGFGDIRIFQMTTPGWLSHTVWQLEMGRSLIGLNIMLRTYGIVPFNAPVFEACETGDTIEMQRLFDNRLATPFDKTESGFSLWDMALMYINADSLRILIQYGGASDVFYGVEDHLRTFHYNAHLKSDNEALLGVGRRLHEDMIWLHDTLGNIIDNSHGQQCHPIFPGAKRLLLCSSEDADSVWFWQTLEFPTIDWTTVRSEETIRDMLDRYVPEHHGGKTPLQLAAVCTANCLRLEGPWGRPNMRCMEGIIAAIIKTGADVHKGDHHHTPLMLFLAAVSWRESMRSTRHPTHGEIQLKLAVWLKILQRAGVDLDAYGAEECRQSLKYRSLEDPIPPLLYWNDTLFPPFINEVIHLTFSYGLKPEDWKVQLDWKAPLDYTIDQYVGDFWEMPGLLDEYKIQAMPGGWIEDV